MKILLAGGAGYIGSHTALNLMEQGHKVTIVDNFSNSSPQVIERIEAVSGQKPNFCRGDVTDESFLRTVMREDKPDCVINFAGYKSVNESVKKPLLYYKNNILAVLSLLNVMSEYHVEQFIFSSSATVYGQDYKMPLTETMQRGNCTNPYGWTKSMLEQILQDAAIADPNLRIISLRYFNPVGAHPSGKLGEDPFGIPNNLMPYITQVAIGKLPELVIYGDDYPTKDGTCMRDFIHIMDLAEAHALAVRYVGQTKGIDYVNIGTGVPYSVKEIVDTFCKVNKLEFPVKIGPRRAGDVAACWADVSKAKSLWGWQAKYDLAAMCRDAWRWQKRNPQGYVDTI